MTGSILLKNAHWTSCVDEHAHEHSIGDVLRTAARRFSNQTALVDGAVGRERRRWSYTELLCASERAAHMLLTRFVPGDRVAIWAANCPEWIIAEFGMALAGLTLVTVNPAYLDEEVSYVLKQSQARGILYQPTFRGRELNTVLADLRDQIPTLEHIISIDEVPIEGQASSIGSTLPRVSPKSPAQIQYTSGTTGRPKGALLSHLGLATNGRLYAQAIGAGSSDIWINPMPLFHTAGCGLVTLGAVQSGGVHVLPGAFDPAHMLNLFEEERGTIMLSVPTMLTRMLDQPGISDRDLSAWRLTTLGGAPVAPELVRRAQNEFKVSVGIGFGQTEASPYITHTRSDDTRSDLYQTVGQPLPGFDVKIADAEDGTTLPCGEVGEVCVRGPCVMLAYFEDAVATAEAIDPDGWLNTGDLGRMDEQGYCRIEGRLKDMIIRGGENVYPREIEEVLITHPAIAGAAVVGLPDPDLGESVAAAIQFYSGQECTVQEIQAFCGERLAFYKTPRTWQVVEDFPQTGSGKIQKFKICEAFLAARDEESVQ